MPTPLPVETPVSTKATTGDYKCQCCTPSKNLHLRPDLGMDGTHPKHALCILSVLNFAAIHVWNGTLYVLNKDFKLALDGSAILGADGKPVAQRAMRVADVAALTDDEEGPAGGRPTRAVGERVDLNRDQFYSN